MRKRKRIHPSGSDKRKLKRQRDAEKEKLKNSFRKYLVPTEKRDLIYEENSDNPSQDESDIKSNISFNESEGNENKIQDKSEYDLKISISSEKKESIITKEDSDLSRQYEKQLKNNTDIDSGFEKSDRNVIGKVENKIENNLEISPCCSKEKEKEILEKEEDLTNQYRDEIKNNTAEIINSFNGSEKNESGIVQSDIENSLENCPFPNEKKENAVMKVYFDVERQDEDKIKINTEIITSNDKKDSVESTEDSDLRSQNVKMKVNEKNKENFNPDPATWNDNHNDHFIDYFIKNPLDQNIELVSQTAKFIGDKNRTLSKNSFFRHKKKQRSC